MFVNLVQAAADGAKFDSCRAAFGKEAGIRGAAAGVVIKAGTAMAGHRTAQCLHQGGVFGEKRLAGKFPSVFGTGFALFHEGLDKGNGFLLQVAAVVLVVVAPVHFAGGAGGDDVFRTTAAGDVADLEGGWREMGVAAVPNGSSEAMDNGSERVDGVARVCRIGDVALFAVDSEVQV